MPAFPALRTGAVAQYPLDRTVRFQTQSVKFMDGSRQRFRLYGAGLRRWKIRLDLLDEQEMAAVVAFLEQQGSSVFPFTDPVTGDSISSCIISHQSYDAGSAGEMNANVSVEIEEVSA
jgi:phage-related protein